MRVMERTINLDSESLPDEAPAADAPSVNRRLEDSLSPHDHEELDMLLRRERLSSQELLRWMRERGYTLIPPSVRDPHAQRTFVTMLADVRTAARIADALLHVRRIRLTDLGEVELRRAHEVLMRRLLRVGTSTTAQLRVATRPGAELAALLRCATRVRIEGARSGVARPFTVSEAQSGATTQFNGSGARSDAGTPANAPSFACRLAESPACADPAKRQAVGVEALAVENE